MLKTTQLQTLKKFAQNHHHRHYQITGTQIRISFANNSYHIVSQIIIS